MHTERPLSVLFFGPSGAGKGTQLQLLKEFLAANSKRDTVHIEMGALLRDLVSHGGITGERTNAIISNGGLMPSFIPNYLLAQHLIEHFTGDEHILADGVARRPPQAKAFDDAMAFYGREDYHVVFIELSPEAVMERLLLRGRNDDTEEGIRKRITWYQEEVAPLVPLFRERGRTVHTINGEPSIEEVHTEVLQALKLV